VYYKAEMKKRKSKKGQFFDMVVKAVATGIFILSIFLNLIFIIIIVVMGTRVSQLKGKDRLTSKYKKVYIDEHSPGRNAGEFAVIRINGIITEYDTREGPFIYRENPVSGVINRLNIIKNDNAIKGVLLIIDSPGGVVTASDMLYRKIISFKEENHLPVITLMKQVATSGAYYVASGTDFIVALPTTITGSIGVIMYNFNVKGLMDKFGVKYVAIKTGEHKDIISPFKSIDESEIKWLKSIVDQMLDQFIDVVDQGRKNLNRGDVKKLADGRIYTAKDARDKGLIDEIGYFDDAIGILKERAGISHPRIVEYRKEKVLRDIIEGAALSYFPHYTGHSTKDLLFGRENENYGIYYIWEGAIVNN